MRILLTANASYVPPRGGATRSNLLWLEYMAARGHECRIVAAALAEGAAKRAQMAQEGLDRQTLVERGVELYEVAERARQAAVLRRQIREFQPDWVLVSSEDLGHALLREAHEAAPGRVVYLAHTPQFCPFGPASWNPDPGATELVTRAAGVVAIGQRTISESGLVRYGSGDHGQSVRGQGHLDFHGAGGALPRVRLRRLAGMGHHCGRPRADGRARQHRDAAELPPHR